MQMRVGDGNSARLRAAIGSEANSRESAPAARARYALALLTIAYAFNLVDRQLVAILLEPIKIDLGASDSMMGLLSGFAFAIFYVAAGIPLARWADVGVRRSIIALGLSVWCGMTAICGFVRNFEQLLVARIGVALGEAAFVPPAHSLISDYFPVGRRATAFAVFIVGAQLGLLFGFAGGGLINDLYGWRAAFMIIGLPGLALAFLIRFTIPEPARHEGREIVERRSSIGEVIRYLWGLKSFRHVSLAGALHAFAGYGLSTWTPTFLVRIHEMSPGEAGIWLGPIMGIGAGLGVLGGGWLSDRFGAIDIRWYMWLPAATSLAAFPCAYGFLMSDETVRAFGFLIPAAILGAVWMAPTTAMVQSLAKPEMRAMAAAILLFVINLIGIGFGPLVVGILNDFLSIQFGAEAIRYSLLIIAVPHVLAAIHNYLAARTIQSEICGAVS